MPPLDNTNNLRSAPPDVDTSHRLYEQTAPAVGERPSVRPAGAETTAMGMFPDAHDILPQDPPLPTDASTGKKISDLANQCAGQPLWEHLHPGGWNPGDDPGHQGGLGCASSVSELLRKAGVFQPNEDETTAQGLQNRLMNQHGWQSAFDSTNAPMDPNNPLQVKTPTEADVQPGDVVVGYRKGTSPGHSGDDAHSGVVARDADGKLVVYSNCGTVDGKEVWDKTPFDDFVKFQGFNDGIVVMRSPKS